MTNPHTMTEEQLAKCREAFNVWAISKGYDPDSRRYLDELHIWQAAWSAAQPQWLPIESAPKDGSKFDACNEFGERIPNVWFERGCWVRWWFTTYREMDVVKIGESLTHWMPLPTPPTQPSDKEES